jgi:ketosteroid isomerase-like protein
MEIRHFVCPDHATVESMTTGSPRDDERFEVHLVDVLTLRDGKIAAKRSYRKARL